MANLTNKQRLFVSEYLIDLNSAGAARRAGYSAHSSVRQGKQLLDTPAIRVEVRKALAKRASRVEVTADEVVANLAEIAYLDRSQAFRVKDGRLYVTDTDLLPLQVRRCIAEVAETQHGLRIKFDDRVRALELLGRHLALFTDNLNVNDQRPKSVDEMTEEELDAELAKLDAQEAAGGDSTGSGEKASA